MFPHQEYKLDPPPFKRSSGVKPKTARPHAKRRRRPEPLYDEEDYYDREQPFKLHRQQNGEAYDSHSFEYGQPSEEEIKRMQEESLYYEHQRLEQQRMELQHEAAQLCNAFSIFPNLNRF